MHKTRKLDWIGRSCGVARTALLAAASVTLVALGALGLLSGCAAPSDAEQAVQVGVEEDRVDPTIFGGALDDDAASVAGVVALRVGGGGTYELCTGALIAPNVVLTARHCVTKNLTTSVSCDENGRSANGAHVLETEEPSNVAVFVGTSPRFGQTPAASAARIVAPKGDVLCDSDIALIVLDRDLDGVEPLPVRLGRMPLTGETIRSVGYGQNDTRSIGTRFRKEGVSVLAMGRAVSESQTPLGQHEFEVGRSICQGDSGGPAISERTGAVIGVVSRGGGCEDDFGHIYTTTAGFEPLFEEAFEIAGGEPTPEDASLATGPAPRSRSAAEPTTATAEEASAGCSAAGAAPRTRGTLAPAALLLLSAAVVMSRASRRRAARASTPAA